jgi:hypothetical protein
LLLSAAVLADLPFGLGVEPWDTNLWSTEQIETVLRTVRSVNTRSSFVTVCWCLWSELGSMSDIMEQEGYGTVQPYFWHKTGHNWMQGAPQTFAQSVETAVVGYYPRASDVESHFPSNPLECHNFLETPGLRKYVLTDAGAKANAHEKPVSAMARILDLFCVQGETVLVLCAGVGGEVRACIRAGLNVVAVEKDVAQFEILCQQMLTWDATLEQELAAEKKLEAKRDAQGSAHREETEPSCEYCGEYLEKGAGPLVECPTCAKMCCLVCLPSAGVSGCLDCITPEEDSEGAAAPGAAVEEGAGALVSGAAAQPAVEASEESEDVSPKK